MGANITVNAIPPGKRRNARAETTLLHEWIDLHGWNAAASYEPRLGPTIQENLSVPMSPALEANLRNRNWYPDAIVITPSELWVIEAKLEAKPGAVGEALFYSTLVGTTPDLQWALNRAVVPVVLFGRIDDTVARFARGYGVRVEFYTPPWIADYLNRRYTGSLPSAVSSE